MSELVLRSDDNSFHSKVLRGLTGVFGLSYLLYNLPQYFSLMELGSDLLWHILLGLTLIGGSLLIKPRLGSGIRLEFSDEYVRGVEQPSFIRTAYWEKISQIRLTAFTLKISYRSGTTESFRLPFLNSKDYKKLKQRLIKMSEEHGFRFVQKAWWKHI